MNIAPFPHHYTVSVDGGELRAAPRAPLAVGAPPQFGGSENVWSPEELLVGAALVCLQTTFEAYARRHDLAVHGFRGAGTGTLVKSNVGPAFSAIRLSVELVVDAGQEERAREILLRAERDCIISRALRAPVELTFSITAASMTRAGNAAERPLSA